MSISNEPWFGTFSFDMAGEEGGKGNMPAVSGAKGRNGSHVYNESHKSASAKKKKRSRDEVWRKRAFGHLVAPDVNFICPTTVLQQSVRLVTM